MTMKEIRFPEDRGQCLWCAQRVNAPIEVRVAQKRQVIVATVCSPACEQESIRAFAFIAKAIPRFLIGLFAGLGLLLMGLSVTLWPMVTPQTVEILGMRRAFVAGRVVGVAAILAAVWIWMRLG